MREKRTVTVIGRSEVAEEYRPLAEKLGVELAKNDFIVAIGAGYGLPLIVSQAARSQGALVVGFSALQGKAEHNRQNPEAPNSLFDFIVLTGAGMKIRNAMLVNSGDAAIMIGGSIGTFSEFAMAYDYPDRYPHQPPNPNQPKIIGILLGSGGITNSIESIEKEVQSKETGAVTIYSEDPKHLVEEVLKLLRDQS